MNIYGGYYDRYSTPGMVDGTLGVVLGVYAFVMLLALAVGVVFYVLQSVSLYAIAKRRGIRNPWLAWIPIGCNWILGSISDQYQYVKLGKVKNRRKILVGLSLGTCAASVIYFAVAFAMGLVTGISGMGGASVFVLTVLVYILVMLCLSIVSYVLMYMAMYDLFASCDPSNAVLYLLLGIFVNVTLSFFLFVCRKKDGGMPPRRDATPRQPAAPQFCPDGVQVQRPVVFPTESPVVPVAQETAVLLPTDVLPTVACSEATEVLTPRDTDSTATLPENEMPAPEDADSTATLPETEE